MGLSPYFTAIRDEAERQLQRFAFPADTYPPVIHEAMRHSLFAGGKRLRPMLAIAAADVIAGDAARERVWPFAAALEMIHTYTLIHDDLPALDDDDLRRGIPTCHKAFGEANAILAGDGLLTHAFDVMAHAENYDQPVDPPTLLRVVAETARAVGTVGTIGGQVVDLQMERNPSADLPILEYIHIHKTGKLIVASLRGGALLAGTDEERLAHLDEFGRCIGLSFQVADDILDVAGETAAMGKTAGADAARGKLTYPSLIGMEESRRLAADLTERAVAALTVFGEPGRPLADLARYIVERTH